jgi:hypothetical protein
MDAEAQAATRGADRIQRFVSGESVHDLPDQSTARDDPEHC